MGRGGEEDETFGRHWEEELAFSDEELTRLLVYFTRLLLAVRSGYPVTASRYKRLLQRHGVEVTAPGGGEVPDCAEEAPKLLSAAQMAKACGLSRKTIARLYRQGKLPGSRPGGKYCFDRQAVLDALAGGGRFRAPAGAGGNNAKDGFPQNTTGEGPADPGGRPDAPAPRGIAETVLGALLGR